MSEKLKLPRMSVSSSSCDEWLTFLRNVAFANTQRFPLGDTTHTTKGMPSYFCNRERLQTVFDTFDFLDSLNRTAKSPQ